MDTQPDRQPSWPPSSVPVLNWAERNRRTVVLVATCVLIGLQVLALCAAWSYGGWAVVFLCALVAAGGTAFIYYPLFVWTVSGADGLIGRSFWRHAIRYSDDDGAFEAWAGTQGINMQVHPVLGGLALTQASAAQSGWHAALRYERTAGRKR